MTVRVVCVKEEGRGLYSLWVWRGEVWLGGECELALCGGGCGTCRFSFLISSLGVLFFFFGRKFFFGGFIIQTDRERKRMRCFYQKKRWRRKEISHRFATSLAVPNGPFRFFQSAKLQQYEYDTSHSLLLLFLLLLGNQHFHNHLYK